MSETDIDNTAPNAAGATTTGATSETTPGAVDGPTYDLASQPKGPTTSPSTCVHICVTCRDASDVEEGVSRCRGQRLYEACEAFKSANQITTDGIDIAPVDCLAVCKRPATIAFTASGKVTYVFGDLDPETAAQDVFAGAAVYGQSQTGLMAWRERPLALRRGTIARIPAASLPTDR